MTPSRFRLVIFKVALPAPWYWRVEAMAANSNSHRWTMSGTWSYGTKASAKSAAMRYCRELGIKLSGMEIVIKANQPGPGA